MSDIVIGTRQSPLALWQANFVKDCIEKRHPGVSVSLMKIKTQGDKILDTPLAKVGGKGLFVKEIEKELIEGNIQLAVHSMKDVPTHLPDETEISVVLEREDPRDALLTQGAAGIDDIPQNGRVGTSSLRRQAQILALRPDLTIQSIRGNVGTRIKKMTEDNLDAIILAVSGLVRMGHEEVIREKLDPDRFIPAVAQGALGIETRKDDSATRDLVMFLNNDLTRKAVDAERAFLARLEGGCQVPIAGHAVIRDGEMFLNGLVGSVDGSVIFRDSLSGKMEDGRAIGVALAEKLLAMGGDKVLAEVYGKDL